ncbi:attacin-C-like [Lucilia sericata]|uniref:attacin-C-like n=1 Tax=Lucilia sericata TaxID=13632 RepID=UPI0018A8159D|nr:attacin-C-like [Lucilia sericata]
MKSLILTIVSVALLGALIEAYPQRVYYQKLPYYPPPTQPPRPIRVRRDLGGQISTNPAGGNNAKVDFTQGIGTPEHNLIGQAFAAGNTKGGPVVTGGTLAYNNNGFGAAITKEHINGISDTLTKSISADFGDHKIGANVFKSDNTLPNGFKFERSGHGLEYSHINGHTASLTQSNIPNFGRQLELAGKANLWSSQDRNTRLDLTGSASKWTSGPFSGQTSYGGGLGLTHFFG